MNILIFLMNQQYCSSKIFLALLFHQAISGIRTNEVVMIPLTETNPPWHTHWQPHALAIGGTSKVQSLDY